MALNLTTEPQNRDFQLILGPMFSGKTSELIKRYSRYSFVGRKCLMIKYANDTRYSLDKVITHDGLSIEAKPTQNLMDLIDSVHNVDVICVDEVQFYSDAFEFCLEVLEKGKILVCSGLNGTFERKPFPIISKLIPLVSDLIFCKSICNHCKSETGCYSKRVVQGEEEILIGGTDAYQARCINCF